MARKPRAEVIIEGKDKTKKGFTSATNNLKRFAASAKKLALGAAVGIAAIGTAAIAVGVKIFDIGSAALETQSKFETIFGDASDNLLDFGEALGKVAGLTRAESQNILANTGAIASGMGFATEAAADMSAQVFQLSADLASFNNLPTADVAAIVSKAMVGETESLKGLGIVVKVADINTRALNDTGKASAAQLTQQEKATAALALVTERAAAANGDLARTQTSAANQAKQVRAQFRQIIEDFSVALIPTLAAVLPILAELATKVADVLPQITDFFITLGDAVGLTNAQVRIELNAIKNAGLTIEQIQARVGRIEQENNTMLAELIAKEEELARVATEGFKGSREELFQKQEAVRLLRESLDEQLAVEVAINDLIETRISSEEALAEAARARTAAEIEASQARAASALAGLEPGVQAIALPPVELREAPIEKLADPTLAAGIASTATSMLDFQLAFLGTTETMVGFGMELGSINEELGEMAGTTLVNFADGWVEAFEAIGAGENVFASVGKAAKRAVADAATAQAKQQIAMGVAKIAAGIFPPNPAAFLSAAQHFASAALFGALGGVAGGVRQTAPGGGVGERGPISGQSLQDVRGGVGVPPAEIVIQGSLLDMSDPAQADALAKAISDLSGRNITVSGGI